MTQPNDARPVVWVVGDAMLDRTLHAEAGRFAQEDPAVPVLRLTGPRRHQPGGAANVAANLAAMGCDVRLFSTVGSDPDTADELAGVCVAAGVTAHLTRDRVSTRTPVKTRVMVEGRLAARIDDEDDIRISPARLPAGGVPGPPPAALVFSDYNKGSVGTAADMVGWHAAAGGRALVFVDPSHWRGAEYARLPPHWAVFTPNRQETAALCGMPIGAVGTNESAVAACRHLTAASAVYLKLGAGGAVCAAGGLATRIPALAPRQVFDVQGAGDTFLAGLVAATVRGLPASLCGEYAVAAAGVAVGRPGTSVVSAADVTAALRPQLCAPVRWPLHQPHDHPDLVAQMEYLADHAAARAAAAGLRVGFTNGCFDLLGRHHTHLLQQAADACDFLVVGVDSDARVAALKGPDRPVVPAVDRAAQVSAVRGVGAVVVFDAEPAAVVGRIRPAVMFKGEDYRGRPVSGAPLLAAWGGELVYLPLLPGYSTTETVNRIRRPGAD